MHIDRIAGFARPEAESFFENDGTVANDHDGRSRAFGSCELCLETGFELLNEAVLRLLFGAFGVGEVGCFITYLAGDQEKNEYEKVLFHFVATFARRQLQTSGRAVRVR